MVTHNEYLKSILTQILDSYKNIKEIKGNPGDLDLLKKELLKINGFMRVIINKIETDNIPVSDYKHVKSKVSHYLDNYFFIKEIETMTPLYSDDSFRIKNMRFKILEALEYKDMIEETEDLIKKL